MSTICLLTLLSGTQCDIGIISEHSLSQTAKMVSSLYKDRWVYKKKHEITDTNSTRVVGI